MLLPLQIAVVAAILIAGGLGGLFLAGRRLDRRLTEPRHGGPAE